MLKNIYIFFSNVNAPDSEIEDWFNSSWGVSAKVTDGLWYIAALGEKTATQIAGYFKQSYPTATDIYAFDTIDGGYSGPFSDKAKMLTQLVMSSRT